MKDGIRFAPSLRLTLFAVLFVPTLCALGVWQWQRAEEKLLVESRLATQAALAPAALDLSRVETPGDLARVRVRGRLIVDRMLLRDNRTFEGRAGYQLHVPLVPDGAGAEDAAVLIDLGWIAAPATRSELPRPELPDGTITLVGTLDRNRQQGVVFGSPATEGGWPRRVQQIDPAAIEALLDRPLYPAIVVADAPMPGVQTFSWNPVRMTSGTHRGYAIQWFGLALVLAAGWLIASLRRPQPVPRHDDHQ